MEKMVNKLPRGSFLSIPWILAVLAVIILTAAACFFSIQKHLQIKDGIAAKATIIDFKVEDAADSEGGGPNHYPIVEFRTSEGEIIKAELNSTWEINGQNAYHIGQGIDIVYSAADPQKVVLRALVDQQYIPWLMLLTGILLIGIAGLYKFKQMASTNPDDLHEIILHRGLVRWRKGDWAVLKGFGVLTDRRFVFTMPAAAKLICVLLKFADQRYEIEIPYDSIKNVSESRFGLSKALLIETRDGSIYTFAVNNYDKWAGLISKYVR